MRIKQSHLSLGATKDPAATTLLCVSWHVTTTSVSLATLVSSVEIVKTWYPKRRYEIQTCFEGEEIWLLRNESKL